MEIKKIHIAIIVAILALSIPIASVCLHSMGTGSGKSTQAGSDPHNRISQIPGSEVYTSPIGGFETDRLIISPNGSFETNYRFFSGNLRQGRVVLDLITDDGKPSGSDPRENITLTPSIFDVVPDTAYRSRLIVTTGPRAHEHELRLVARYFDPANDSKWVFLPYGNDTLSVWNGWKPGTSRCIHDGFSLENSTILIKKGMTRTVNGTFTRSCTGLGQVTLDVSETPLHVTAIPSSFIAKKNTAPFPVMFVISAPLDSSTGFQAVNITVSSPTSVDSWAGEVSILHPPVYSINVTITDN